LLAIFVAEQQAIEAIRAELAAIEQQLEDQKEEQGGEEGLLAEVIEGEGDKQKIPTKALKARLKEIGNDPERSPNTAQAGRSAQR
jgi:type I restriction enzyme M protein